MLAQLTTVQRITAISANQHFQLLERCLLRRGTTGGLGQVNLELGFPGNVTAAEKKTVVVN